MRCFFTRPTRGISLVELVISIGIMAFIFSAMAYMTFATGRNSLVIREQARSQNQAGSASERIAATLRNARFMKGYSTDDISTTLTRLVYEIPDPSEDDGVREGVVAFVPATNANTSDGVIKVFENADDFSPDTLEETKADWEYSFIQDFAVRFHSPSWITLTISYTYRGFTLSTTDSDNDGVQDSLLAGQFQTDIIAKNHHPGESAHYAETTNTLMQL